MIKRLFAAFLIITGITACTKNSDLPYNVDDDWNEVKSIHMTYQEICGNMSDAVQYPDPWTEEISDTFVITEETILSMSTCGLLNTYLSHPDGDWVRGV